MNKHARLPFLGLLKVSLLGVTFPLLLTNLNWAQANTKQDNSLLYAQTVAPSTPQPSKPAEVKNTNSPPEKKKQEEEEKSDGEKKEDKPWFVLPIGLGVVAILYLGVLRFNPLLLLWLPAELKIPKIAGFGGFPLPLGLVIWLKYRPRVLDAWVEKHINIYRLEFNKSESVSRRENYVSLPVKLLITNEPKEQNLIADDLKKTFREDKRLRLLIWGDGGTGKTTIACRIANWAMAEDKEKRLTEHFMLPVLIEQEPESPSGEKIKALMEDIVGQVQNLTNAEKKIVDNLLVEQLLEKRRILLILDRFSEMNSDTRDKINPKKFLANALVVTSRIEEADIGNIDIKINTLPLDGVDFTNFIKQYLKKHNQWKSFENDQENFLKECAKLLATFGGKKTIIALFAQLHGVRIINGQENLSGKEESSDKIPDLIVEYVKTLNEDVEKRTGQSYHTWEEDAKLIAWKCLERDYKPNYVACESIVAVVGKEKADNIVNHFHKNLHLIKLGESQTIKFALDTLAEYLAGLYLVENYKKAEWEKFIQKVDENPDKRKEIKGFLLAVRECCITKGGKETPSSVADTLGKLAGLDLEAEKKEKEKQRIDRLFSELSNPELGVESKQAAVKQLQKMAETSTDALDSLLISLKIENITVRGDAAAALGNLGNNSMPVLNGLLALLQDKQNDVSVRRNAAEALGNLGNPSKPVLDELSALLQDEEEYDLHYDAVTVLGKLGNASERVLKGLLAPLKDKDYYNVDVRRNAAEVLGNLGNASERVIKGLLAPLQDQHDDVIVRRNAVAALAKLGNASKPVLDGLARLENGDEDSVVREAATIAWETLKKLGTCK